MPIKEGWEVSPDRGPMYEKIMSKDPVGNPIITTKTKLDRENGFLVVSDNGFAWRIKMGMSTSMYSAGKSKWIRWCDVAGMQPKKPGVLIVELKIRKKGALILDGKGNYKIKKWKFTIQQNKGEDKAHFRERQNNFNAIMIDLMSQYKVETDPPTSDSRL